MGSYWRFLEIGPRVENYLRDKEAAVDAASREGEAEKAPRQVLQDMVEDLADLEATYRQVNQSVEDHRELMAIDGKLDSIEGELTSLQQAIDRFDGDGAMLLRQEAALTEQLRQSTGGDGDLADLVEKFEEGCRGKQAYDAADRDLRENEERRGLVLRGKSRRELEEERRRAADETQRLLEKSPSLEGARTNASRDELEVSLEQRQTGLHECDLEIAELRTTIGKELARLRPRAEVEEELARYRADVVVLERFGGELQVAMEVIEQAMVEAHRDFAPSVGRFLSSGMAKITRDRYERLLLDPSQLSLTAEVPETRDFKDVELLSRGTRAAAYLLLRVGLSQHMSSMGEPVPLILDDPLVDLDDVRVENFLELLMELSDQVQILLFTKDATTKTWFEREGCGGEGRRMTLLSAPGS